MSSRRSALETEIKLRVPSPQAARRLLLRQRFRVTAPRVFESNLVLDTPGIALRSSGRLLRLRTSGKAHRITYKGPASVGRHKSREEIEFSLDDPAAAARVFAALGFEPLFRYEKYRTEFARPRNPGGIVTLDETPVGAFLELEGEPAWIDRVAADLGFSPSDYITASYGALYASWCRERGLEPSHMVFQRR